VIEFSSLNLKPVVFHRYLPLELAISEIKNDLARLPQAKASGTYHAGNLTAFFIVVFFRGEQFGRAPALFPHLEKQKAEHSP
jgi:hypothetical protein